MGSALVLYTIGTFVVGVVVCSTVINRVTYNGGIGLTKKEKSSVTLTHTMSLQAPMAKTCSKYTYVAEAPMAKTCSKYTYVAAAY